MSTLSQRIKNVVQNPRRTLHVLHTMYQRRARGRRGVDIVGEDWDNLLILDACRYDVFADLNELDGYLESRISRGSTTTEFLEKNFDSGEFPEIVYLSGNPNLTSIDARFHERIRLFTPEFQRELWSDRFEDPPEIVFPETVAEQAIDAHDRFPNKRLIVHFVQPHSPHIGAVGERLYERHELWWQRLRRGEIDREDAWEAYRENVEIVLPHVERVVEALDGKTVITADHGEMFGRLGIYEHPGKMFTEELVKVPWFVIESDQRKSIEAGTAFAGPAVESQEVQDGLADLGYVPQREQNV